MEENIEAVIPTATAESTNAEITTSTNTAGTAEQSAEEVPTITASQMNNIIKERLEKAKSKAIEEGGTSKITEICERYGVNNLDELDSIIGKAQAYDEYVRTYDSVVNDAKNSKTELAFVKNNIDPDKYEDIKTHFKGLNEDITNEKLVELVKTHPEWLKKIATVNELGNETREIKKEEDFSAIKHEYWGL